MSMRRQAYEWRNILPTGETVHKNGYPIVSINDCESVALSDGIPYDIFVGNVGNTLDVPGELKAFQYIIIDAIAVWPQNLYAQVYVNTTKYFQDPDNVPSRSGGISGFIVPFPNGARWVNGSGGVINIVNTDYTDGLKPAVIIAPGQVWGVEVTSSVDIASITNTATEQQIQKCFVKYLLIDGADAIVARRLLGAGWPLTVENVWKYKQDILKTHLYAGLAPLPTEVVKAKRKV